VIKSVSIFALVVATKSW